MTIELGARSGYSQARIQLAPPELGEIRINLHQTADGLVAKVTAADGAAAQTLQQGGAELRRSLESAGVTLLRLDIGSSLHNGPSAGQSGFAGRTPNGAPTDRGDSTDEDSADGPIGVGGGGLGRPAERHVHRRTGMTHGSESRHQ